MESLKERLANRPDLTEKTITIAGEKMKIRRLTVRERDNVLKDKGPKADGSNNYEAGAMMSRQVVAAGLIEPTTTFQELDDLPAAIVEDIAKEIMEFNGWSVQGQKTLDDQFRTPAGPPV